MKEHLDDDDEITVIDYRRCAFCKYQGDPDVDLFRYSVRHYAHAVCLAKRHGTKAAAERLPIGDLKSFRVALKSADAWDKAAIRVRDQALARIRKAVGSE